MTDWRNNPALEAPSSREARTRATTAAWERATPPVLSKDARTRFLNEVGLAVAVDEAKEAALFGVLEALAHQAVHEHPTRPALRKRDDLLPLLKWWKRWRDVPTPKAQENLRVAWDAAKDRGYGLPSPFEHPDIFERRLADAALARRVEWSMLAECIARPVLIAAVLTSKRVKATRWALHKKSEKARRSVQVKPQRGWRGLLKGGRRPDARRDRQVEMLLAVYFLLFGKAPATSIASVRLRERTNGREATAADGGAAVRFIVAFESEIVAEPRSSKAVLDHLDHLLARQPRAWERWTLAVNADGSPAPMLIRAEFAPFQK